MRRGFTKYVSGVLVFFAYDCIHAQWVCASHEAFHCHCPPPRLTCVCSLTAARNLDGPVLLLVAGRWDGAVRPGVRAGARLFELHAGAFKPGSLQPFSLSVSSVLLRQTAHRHRAGPPALNCPRRLPRSCCPKPLLCHFPLSARVCEAGRAGQRVEKQGTWASQKHSEAGYGRPVDRGVWTAKQSNNPGNNQHNPQYANYWAPLTRKRHIPPHPAQPRHTNYWASRTRKRHQQEHRPQRPTERSDPTQHAKGRTGDHPGPRKETATRRNFTQGGGRGGLPKPTKGPSFCGLGAAAH